MRPPDRPEEAGFADEAEVRTVIERYVDQLRADGAVGPAAVERAFRTVERHRLRVVDPAEMVHEPDPAPRVTARRPDEPMGITDDETDFLFFLGLHDRRGCHAPQGPGLSDGPDGWAALAPDGIRWWKDASLARELDQLYRAWDARGRRCRTTGSRSCPSTPTATRRPAGGRSSGGSTARC